MPITPCFDPTTGASGGAAPAGGGGSLYALAPTIVDLTDGSWTLFDPDSLIKSVAHSAGSNTVTFNALAVGSNDYNWSTGADCRAPRWYRKLEISGSQVKSVDTLNFTTALVGDLVVNDFSRRVVVGPCFDPTSTVATTIAGTGGAHAKSVGGAQAQYGVWTVNGEATFSNTLQVKGLSTVMRSNNCLGSGTYIGINSAGVAIGQGSRNANVLAATGGLTLDVYVLVGVGTRNIDTIPADGQFKFSANYSAITTVFGA